MKARTKTQLQLIIVFIKWKKYSIQKKTEKGNKEKITDELNRKHEQDSSFKFNCIFNYVNCNNWNRPQRGSAETSMVKKLSYIMIIMIVI